MNDLVLDLPGGGPRCRFSFEGTHDRGRCLASWQTGNWLAAFITDPGGREENQDAWGWAETAGGGLLVSVADGLGGHAAGRTAAWLAMGAAVETVLTEDYAIMSPSALPDIFNRAEQAILRAAEADASLIGMRSAMVCVTLQSGLARWAHVGDTRLYHIRQGSLSVTRDQSVPQMLVDMGQIRPDQIRGHPDRSRLLEALGSPDRPTVPVFLPQLVPVEPGDWLILASDGFWAWLDDGELLELTASASPDNVLAEAEARLKKNVKTDEYDNYTAVFLHYF